jgi:adenylate cyclase
VVDAVRCAIEVQNGMMERNAGLPPERRIEFRVGIHLGDVVEEADGDLMGDGVCHSTRRPGSGGWCRSGHYDAETARVEKSLAELKRIYTLKLFAGGEEAKELSASLAKELAVIVNHN